MTPITLVADRYTPSHDLREPAESLSGLLDDLESLVAAMAPDSYTATPVPGVSGSIGKHVRHLLDHVSTFLEASGASVLDYDRRHRGGLIETDPAEALSMMFQLQQGLERMMRRPQDEHLRVRTQLDAHGASMTSWSTLGRELAFVINHTIHHQALIAVLVAMVDDMPLPARFGFAPSTPIEQ
jgi:uncharacterized damage-inducible protein DinB